MTNLKEAVEKVFKPKSIEVHVSPRKWGEISSETGYVESDPLERSYHLGRINSMLGEAGLKIYYEARTIGDPGKEKLLFGPRQEFEMRMAINSQDPNADIIFTFTPVKKPAKHCTTTV
jgi:hypothetical protein